MMAACGKLFSRAARVDVSEMQEPGVLQGGGEALGIPMSCMAS